MPYNPSTGVYALPAIYLAIPGTVIIAAQHNTPLEDLATANNYARPIIAGGTGANNSTSATQNLRAVSYDAQSFIASEKATARRNIIAPYASKAADYTAVADDVGSTLRFTAAATLSLTAAATLANGWAANVIADGGAVTVDPNGSETINGQTTLIVPNGTTAEIICDGSNFFTVRKPALWEPIGTGIFPLAAASSLIITDLGVYRMLRLTGRITPSSATGIYLRTSTDNGASWANGSSDYSYQTCVASGATVGAAAGSEGAMAICRNTVLDITFETVITGFNNSSNAHSISKIYTNLSPSGVSVETNASQRNSSVARNALQLLPNSAATLSGYVSIEGLRA